VAPLGSGRMNTGDARGEPPAVLVLGPARSAVSGVSTHLNLLFSSELASSFRLLHFQVGSEGRNEGRMSRLARLLISPVALLATIVSRRVRVVHINSSLNRGAFWRDLAYLLVAKACGSPVLYQVHGGDLPEDFFRGRSVLTRFLKGVLNLPEAVAVLASVELRAYRRFLPARPVLLLPNAVDCEAMAMASRPCHAPPAGPLCLVYIGRLADGKGLDETLLALQMAHSRGVRARLTIAGAGPNEGLLKRMVQKMGLEDWVNFPGPVFGDAKLRLLGQSDAFLLPSYAEGLPYAMLESMAVGVPVIVTRVGAIPDVVSDGTHGLFVELRDAESIADAIVRMDADRGMLARMGAACRERIREHYSMRQRARDF